MQMPIQHQYSAEGSACGCVAFARTKMRKSRRTVQSEAGRRVSLEAELKKEGSHSAVGGEP